MEKYFTMYKSHSIYIDNNGITIDDFYYSLQNDLPISKIEKIYEFPDGYLQNLVDTHS